MDTRFNNFRSNPFPKPNHKKAPEKVLEMPELELQNNEDRNSVSKNSNKISENPKKSKKDTIHKSNKDSLEDGNELDTISSQNHIDKYNDFLFDLDNAKYFDTRISRPESENNSIPHSTTSLSLNANDMNSTENSLESQLTVLSLSKFNHVIFTNALKGNIKQAEEAFELMKDAFISPTLKTYDHMLLGYANSGNLKKAVSIFKQIESNNLTHSVYSYGGLIKAYIKNNRLDDAYKVYELMKTKGVMPTESIYDNLLLGCISFGDSKRAWGTFEHLRFEIASPSVKSMTIMINACILDDQVEKALTLLDEMIANNQQLTDVTFNSLIKACAHRPGYLNNALELLVKMELTGFKPDYYTYNTIIYACARNKNLEMARHIFNELIKKSNQFLRLDESSFTNLFWTYASHIKHVNIRSRKDAMEYLKNRGPVSIFPNDRNNEKRLLKISEKNDQSIQNYDTVEQLQNPLDDKKSVEISTSNDSNSKDLNNKTLVANDEVLEISKLPSLDDLKSLKNLPLETQITALNNQLDPIFLRKLPTNHKTSIIEASRVYKHFKSLVHSGSIPLNSLNNPDNEAVTTRLLNSYLAVLVNHGEYFRAWQFYCTEFQKLGAKRDGWTIEIILFCCDIQRDIEKADLIWQQFKVWRKEVEYRITKGSGKVPILDQNDPSNDIDAELNQNNDSQNKNDVLLSETENDSIETNDKKSDDNNLIVIEEWFHLPNIQEDSSILTFRDREYLRKEIGSKNDQLLSALNLVSELKTGIPDHIRNELNTRDFSTILSRATQLEDGRAVARLLGLCRPTKDTLKKNRNSKLLNKKWGTNKKFEVGIKKRIEYRNMYPEEFKTTK
ncbi:Pentatricopeptide repeat-containing protein [Smittium mucronatum]|uniref:Pentatricopeptide repeat-containing protein n=1 Tax=Smittium mucronatum TaxID=133383 RepID=A0A1R0GYF8_9FUNG|nr:Pentatricopeptide repeat-containing protein [Smittium mucronatum]